MAETSVHASQLRAARSLLKMSQAHLSELSGVSVPTIKRMEGGEGPIRGTYGNVSALIAVLKTAGIEFVNTDYEQGVRVLNQQRPVDPGLLHMWVARADQIVVKFQENKDRDYLAAEVNRFVTELVEHARVTKFSNLPASVAGRLTLQAAAVRAPNKNIPHKKIDQNEVSALESFVTALKATEQAAPGAT